MTMGYTDCRDDQRAASAGVVLEEILLTDTESLTAAAQLWLDQLADSGVDVIRVSERAYQQVAFGERESGPVAVARPPKRSLAWFHHFRRTNKSQCAFNWRGS